MKWGGGALGMHQRFWRGTQRQNSGVLRAFIADEIFNSRNPGYTDIRCMGACAPVPTPRSYATTYDETYRNPIS